MRKPCIWVYRFHLFDGENVFTYCLEATNIKHAVEQMKIIIDRDYPEFDIIDRERICSASKYSGGIEFPVYSENLTGKYFWKKYNEFFGVEV